MAEEDKTQYKSGDHDLHEMLAAMNLGTEKVKVCPAAGSSADNIPPSQAEPFDVPRLDSGTVTPSGSAQTIDLIRDVELDVRIELGRSRMRVDEVLKLGQGSVVELDKLAGEPVDVLVNDQLVARGEVMILNDNFCIRVSEIISHDFEAPDK
ncbi:MAG: flagellar motor switch protein FliN [Planctomycetota bacterium]|jgi:flagellar motor switch protein FliN/FliY